MHVRRVVTGATKEGKSVVVSDTRVSAITLDVAPGYEFCRLWGADETVRLPSYGSPPSYPAYFPPVGGFRFGLFTVPPEARVELEDLDVEGKDGKSLKASLSGEELERERHRIINTIKAPTYHLLNLKKDEKSGRWSGSVIFDV